jgi:hypothetical protein
MGDERKPGIGPQLSKEDDNERISTTNDQVDASKNFSQNQKETSPKSENRHNGASHEGPKDRIAMKTIQESDIQSSPFQKPVCLYLLLSHHDHHGLESLYGCISYSLD